MKNEEEAMNEKYTIKVRGVGQGFACNAVVYAGRRVLHTTRDVPYGMSGVAYKLAERWISEVEAKSSSR
jgi:hypothetical protein